MNATDFKETSARVGPSIERISAQAYTIPTDQPEADGTLAWDRTTIVVATVSAGGEQGLGYTYADAAAVPLIERVLAPVLRDHGVNDIPAAWHAMRRALRNIGARGLGACALSALDVALWDVKARLLRQPLAALLGLARQGVPIYGSGGFTSYSDRELQRQLGGWVERDGCRAVKMKIGADSGRDLERMRAARAAIGEAALFVDANGAYSVKQALALAREAVALGVRWFEEPVSSDDRAGLRFVRDHAPPGIDIAAGEYGYTPEDFRDLLHDDAVDVLQADATRCGGYTGFLRAAALADAQGIPLSAHCAPALHLPVCCAAPRLRNIEWFHDHVRIEDMIFKGAPKPHDGAIAPDLAQPGHGLALDRAAAARFAVDAKELAHG